MIPNRLCSLCIYRLGARACKPGWASGLVAAIVVALFPVWAGAATGTVRVLYPDALAPVMQKSIAPAFRQATGYKLESHPVTASEVASTVLASPGSADVLICANPRDNLKLIGLPRDEGVEWYLMFMQSPLVVGYNKNGKFASQLGAKPWYEVAMASGFKLGVTDPDTDAKGQLIADALHRVVKRQGKTAARKVAANSRIVPAQDLVQRVQSDGLDATFFYESQAVAAGIPHVGLHLGSIDTTYTVSVLNHAGKPQAAAAFVAFLVGAKGRALLRQDKGLRVMPRPVVFGNMMAVPEVVRAALHKRLDKRSETAAGKSAVRTSPG